MPVTDLYSSFYFVLAARLILASILGAIIGYEREHMHKPAGLRTHTLVCVGSALVMLTSEYIFQQYGGRANIDPARLGAQVISGIGFLGAGTIIKEGFSIKGLTTAATLWIVACVGIAAGIGFYEGAIISTVLIYVTLIVLKRVQDSLSRKNKLRTIYIQARNLPGQIGSIGDVLGRYDVTIMSIEFSNGDTDKITQIKFLVKFPENLKDMPVIDDLYKIEGIEKVYED